MKNLIILSTICLLFMNCSVSEKPQFIGLENIQISESTSKHITFTAQAKFINPNDIGGELQTDEIKVFINNNEMASVSADHFEVPPKNEFSIPLKTKVPTDSIFSDKNLSGLLGSLFSKKVKIQYKGEIKYKVLGFSHYYKVDKTEDVKIKF
ncbi:MAG: LEA type 2 family protein [Algibacter sp.]|uniref:LEA type 2 family protein n=1 Tax=Algibacter sp. TaxID=1872428 RepID=UPI00329742C0